MAMLESGTEHWAIWKHVQAMVKDGRQNAFLRWTFIGSKEDEST